MKNNWLTLTGILVLCLGVGLALNYHFEFVSFRSRFESNTQPVSSESVNLDSFESYAWTGERADGHRLRKGDICHIVISTNGSEMDGWFFVKKNTYLNGLQNVEVFLNDVEWTSNLKDEFKNQNEIVVEYALENNYEAPILIVTNPSHNNSWVQCNIAHIENTEYDNFFQYIPMAIIITIIAGLSLIMIGFRVNNTKSTEPDKSYKVIKQFNYRDKKSNIMARVSILENVDGVRKVQIKRERDSIHVQNYWRKNLEVLKKHRKVQ